MYIRATSFLVSNRDLHMSIGTDTKLPPLYAQEMEKKIELHILHNIFFSLWYNLILLQLWFSHTQSFI